jgi:hypothetical protein
VTPIVFFSRVVVFIFVYLVGGMVFQTVLRKAEGKERVPNIAFWSALPSLIKVLYLIYLSQKS